MVKKGVNVTEPVRQVTLRDATFQDFPDFFSPYFCISELSESKFLQFYLFSVHYQVLLLTFASFSGFLILNGISVHLFITPISVQVVKTF